jgi:uncharacterized phage protein (TIGR01671 family)
MKREIKFRCWSVDAGRWLEQKAVYEELAEQGMWNPERSELFVLQQSTGLKDKNGKEIYEGDIVRAVLFYPESIFDGDKVTLVEETNRVIFDKGCWCIDGEDDYDGGVLCRYDELYVLGNVFETPSLLTNQVK